MPRLAVAAYASGVENEHREVLRRVYQAEKLWSDDGNAPRTFLLTTTGGETIVDHPRWNNSWPIPSPQTIDDLGDAGCLRIEPVPPNRTDRTFSLTAQGRLEGQAIEEQPTQPVSVGGRAPTPPKLIEWLLEIDEAAPECLERPELLFERAIADGLIDETGRTAFARRMFSLVDDGYVRGEFVKVQQANGEQLLAMGRNLQLTTRAYATREPAPAASITVLGSIVNSQVALGDITNTTTFMQVLDRVEAQIDDLADVDDETKQGAKRALDWMRGRSADALGDVATGTAAGLALKLVGHAIGVPLG